MQSGRLNRDLRERASGSGAGISSGGKKKKRRFGRRVLAFGIALALTVTTPSINVGMMEMQAADDAELEEVLAEDGLEKEFEEDAPELISFKDEELTRAVEEGEYTIDAASGEVLSAKIEYNGNLLEEGVDFTADAVLKSSNTKADCVISTYDVTVTGMGGYTDFAVAHGITVSSDLTDDDEDIDSEDKDAKEDAFEEDSEEVSVSSKRTIDAPAADSGDSSEEPKKFEKTVTRTINGNDTPADINTGELVTRGYQIYFHDFGYTTGDPYITYKADDPTKGCTPAIFVANGSQIYNMLNANNYDVAYYDVMAVTGLPSTVVVTGKGEYAGSVLTKHFTLVSPIGDGLRVYYGPNPTPQSQVINNNDVLKYTKEYDGSAGLTPENFGISLADLLWVTWNGSRLYYNAESAENPIGYKLKTRASDIGVTSDAIITLELPANYASQKMTLRYAIVPRRITNPNINITSSGTLRYNGTKQLPTFVVSDAGAHINRTLEEGVDYIVESTREDAINVGTYTATITGIGNYQGTTEEISFAVEPKQFIAYDQYDVGKDIQVVLNTAAYEYTGNNITPDITVTDMRIGGGTQLVEGLDYTIEYTNAVNVNDHATVTLKGIGNYKDDVNSIPVDFKITRPSTETYVVTLGAVASEVMGGGTLDFGNLDPYNGKVQGTPVKVGVKKIGGGVDDVTAAINNNPVTAGSINAGEHSFDITVPAAGNHAGGTFTVKYNIPQKQIDSTMISINVATGVVTEGSVVVTDEDRPVGEKTLIRGTDYTVTTPTSTYDRSTGTKTYTLYVSGMGNYSGTNIEIKKDITEGQNIENLKGQFKILEPTLYPAVDDVEIATAAAVQIGANDTFTVPYWGEQMPIRVALNTGGAWVSAAQYFDVSSDVIEAANAGDTVYPIVITPKNDDNNGYWGQIVFNYKIGTADVTGTKFDDYVKDTAKAGVNTSGGVSYEVNNEGTAMNLSTIFGLKYQVSNQVAAKSLVLGTDYRVTVSPNGGTGKVAEDGITIYDYKAGDTYAVYMVGLNPNYKGTRSFTVKIGKKGLDSSSVSVRYFYENDTSKYYDYVKTPVAYDRSEHKVGLVDSTNINDLFRSGQLPGNIALYDGGYVRITDGSNFQLRWVDDIQDWKTPGTKSFYIEVIGDDTNYRKGSRSKTFTYEIQREPSSNYRIKVYANGGTTESSKAVYNGATTWDNLKVEILKETRVIATLAANNNGNYYNEDVSTAYTDTIKFRTNLKSLYGKTAKCHPGITEEIWVESDLYNGRLSVSVEVVGSKFTKALLNEPTIYDTTTSFINGYLNGNTSTTNLINITYTVDGKYQIDGISYNSMEELKNAVVIKSVAGESVNRTVTTNPADFSKSEGVGTITISSPADFVGSSGEGKVVLYTNTTIVKTDISTLGLKWKNGDSNTPQNIVLPYRDTGYQIIDNKRIESVGDIVTSDDITLVQGTDYTVRVTNPANISGKIRDVGIYTIQVKAADGNLYYSGEATLYVYIKYDLSNASISADLKTVPYDNKYHYSKLTITIGGKNFTLAAMTPNPDTATGNTNKIKDNNVDVNDFKVTYRSAEGTVDDTKTIGYKCVKLEPRDNNMDTLAMGEKDFTNLYQITKVSNTVAGITVSKKAGAPDVVYSPEPADNTPETWPWDSLIEVKDSFGTILKYDNGDYTINFANATGFYKNVSGVPIVQAGRSLLPINIEAKDYREGGTIYYDGFEVKPKSFANTTILADDVMYSGEIAEPTVLYDGTKDEAHKIDSSEYSFSNSQINVGGPYTITVNDKLAASGNYEGTGTAQYTIKPLKLSSATLVTGNELADYTGSVLNPEIKLSIPSGGNPIEVSSKSGTPLFNVVFQNIETGDTVLKNAGRYRILVKKNPSAGSKVDDEGGASFDKGTFTVQSKSIAGAEIAVTPSETWKGVGNYDGTSTVGPIVKVVDTSVQSITETELTYGTDYTLTVNNVPDSSNTVTGTGSYSVIVEGTGNYTGRKSEPVVVEVGAALSDLTETKIIKFYDGTKVFDSTLFREFDTVNSVQYGVDYTVDATAVTSAIAGTTGELTLIAKAGTQFYGKKKLEFEILGAKGYDVTYKLKGLNTDNGLYAYYTGDVIRPEVTDIVLYKDSVKQNVVLKEGTDYKIVYGENTQVGTGTGKVTLSLINYGDASGNKVERTKNFDIRPAAIETNTFTAVFTQTSTTSLTLDYDGTDRKPQITVTGKNKDGRDVTITSNDYTITYSNNRKVGTATANIVGKGNFTGSLTLNFTIVGNFASSTSKFTVPKQLYTGEELTKLSGAVVEVGGNTLKAGTDYTIKLTSTDNFKTAGTVEFAPVNTKLYTGVKSVTFEIGNDKTMYNLSGIANAYTYNGNTIKPEVKIKDINGNDVATTTTTVTYKNSTDGNNCVIPGTVTMNVDVKVGEETVSLEPVTYSIIQKNINSCSIGSAADVAYSGNAFTPTPTISSGNGLLQAGTDYTITYQNNVDPGTARIRITGKGNYTGVADLYFNIYMPEVKNLKATTLTSGSKIKLTWDKPSEEFTGYRISYRPNDGTQRQVVVGKNVTKKTFSNLVGGSTYTFIVQTYTEGAGGRTGYGDAVVATAATKTETPVITLKKAGKGKIKVSWKKISGAGGYMVYRKQSGGKYKRIKTITNGNTISYTNSGLVSGRKYVYRVIAYRSAGGKRTYSSYSPAKSITCK